jgi:chaperone BCS1
MSGASLIDLLASAIRGGIEPEKLFELYVPGFTSLRDFFSKWFRVDLTKVMSFGFFCLLYMTAGRSLLSQVYEHILGYLTSTISIPPDDRVNREVLTWMSQHLAKRSSRFLAVQSAGAKSPWGSDYVSASDKSSLREALNATGMTDRKKAVHYYPAMGKQYFMFQGRPFIFDLLPGKYVWREDFNSVPNGDEPILVRCLGRSSTPLKRFLEHCREHSLRSNQNMTTIHTTQIEKYGSKLQWREASTRPIRPLSTIDLAEGIKQDMLKDINGYLHPSTRLFYARRGVPYRRGYLFYGPPGTGKTSFSLALAGHFEIDLYIVSLASKNLDDDILNDLFNDLPPKCIVLLEDIDSAGIDREVQNKTVIETSKEKDKDETKTKDKHTISLSGLLNTIDGAASQEGRILIMTSNTPETLDAALIRHGRIDKQIKFDYIRKFDAKQLFIRMFTLHEDEKIDDSKPIDLDPENPFELMDVPSEPPEKDIERFAEEFAAKIPERMLSPAEIQGFLLDHRDDVKRAVAKVSDWIVDTLAARSKKAGEATDVRTNNSTISTGTGVKLTPPPRPHSR